ncbi:thiazolylpeptide-type bacteriocin [Actinoplanes sp. HUAS TT8]|uniref:thiazolylpeptide-type bacteriocin n=1 Tax=Actinoplanes sp. HUAS TT8 TaxID=3447453 RepID=UPI003F51CF80
MENVNLDEKLDQLDLDDLDLSELNVTSLRDTVGLPETAASTGTGNNYCSASGSCGKQT